MISEGTCDIEDWSNDAENSALITAISYILQYIDIGNAILNCNNTSQYYCLYSNKYCLSKHYRRLSNAYKPRSGTEMGLTPDSSVDCRP